MAKFIIIGGKYINIYQIATIESRDEDVVITMSSGECVFTYARIDNVITMLAEALGA